MRSIKCQGVYGYVYQVEGGVVITAIDGEDRGRGGAIGGGGRNFWLHVLFSAREIEKNVMGVYVMGIGSEMGFTPTVGTLSLRDFNSKVQVLEGERGRGKESDYCNYEGIVRHEPNARESQRVRMRIH